MNNSYDRIRVLLIDDQPDGLYHDETRKNYPWISNSLREPVELSKLFELRWIATSGEAREYRDLSRLISQHDPAQLDWLPEIVVIDYMLLDKHGSAEDRLRPHPDKKHLCPNPSLRRSVASPSMKLQLNQEVQLFSGAKGILESESDYGCFAGGMILALFADHPSVPVTTTAHSQDTIRRRMTGFFEWLLAEDTNGALRAEQQHGMGWLQIVQQAAPRLRERIKELARIRAISLPLEDLLALAEGHDVLALPIESKYGIRRLPIKGLFCDKPAHEVDSAAQEWAGQLFSLLLGELEVTNHFPNLKDAMHLADKVWKAYLDDGRVKERLELGRLVTELKGDSNPDTARLKELWERFSTEPFNCDLVKKSRGINRTDIIAEIRSGNVSNLARRWACLMILVRLLQLRCTAKRFSKQTDIGERLNELLGGDLQEYDVYLAWFPVASNPVDLSDVTSKGWAKVLERNVDDPSTVGVSLNIDDLLRGRPWQTAPDTKAYGLRPGERELLHWYALSLEPPFPRVEWKRDDQSRRVLLGGA